MRVEELVEKIKAKVMGSLGRKRNKKPYEKIAKSASIKVEIRSRKARQIIEKTLSAADDQTSGSKASAS
ncbi:hypothetical protein KSP40_PGU017586 [Platanthera guangdongensis]|uniref:Uncharacterized protein n=1 Tax=Platanthera guangdongensis TaxID=2320717 RepID=A0ABR2LEK4_9ASPA